jgi:hypothetical protein
MWCKCSEVEWSVVVWSLNEGKWSVDKCSEVEWSVVVWSVVGWSLNERKGSADKCSEVEWSVVVWSVVGWSCVNWSEDISNRVFTIIRSYVYRSYEVCCLYGFIVHHIPSYSVNSTFYHCIYGWIFCMLLFNFVNYVVLLLCLCIFIVIMFCSVYSLPLCRSVYCLCVNMYCTTATGCQPNCS